MTNTEKKGSSENMKIKIKVNVVTMTFNNGSTEMVSMSLFSGSQPWINGDAQARGPQILAQLVQDELGHFFHTLQMILMCNQG